jgi:NADPH:quinone reductase-like Zn-dependent oxidoreductase
VSAHVATTDLEFLSNLIEAGKVHPHIDRRYAFAEIPAAITYLEQGHARGKVVVGAPRDPPSGPPSYLARSPL